MIEKKLVERNFSKNAATYDKYAEVQREMAKKLVELCVLEIKPVKILEIGCGTGIFTELLLSNYAEAEIDILDISESMLETAKDKFGDEIENYICADAETYLTSTKYDLIISNASFQWFKNINTAISHLKSLLTEKGQIYFSLFASDTYFELREAFRMYNPNYVFSQNFISLEDFDRENHELEILLDEYIPQNFKNLLEFLKAVKGIGANSALKDKKTLTKNILKQIEKLYIERFDGINVTNHLMYIRVGK